ncbi:MAG TPA: glycine betaine ABC transporter substrate-binding protein [Pseudonocardiaceae bacterium]|nr:glycine betaine ABC transporter substrate-binding protein [Pseudonocardiaceae bacterium]
MLAATVAATVLAGGCGSGGGGTLSDQVNPIDLKGQSYIVGGKDSPEQQVLCEIAGAALGEVGADVEERCGLGDAQANRDALTRGEIDLYWENTGTAWTSFLKQPPVSGASAQYRALEKRDLAENKIVWLEPTWFNPTATFALKREQAKQHRLGSISDMVAYLRSDQPGTLCISPEYQRDTLPGLQRAYDFQVPPNRLKVQPADSIYQATGEAKDCLFGQVTGADQRLIPNGLVMLRDDKKFHPSYNASVAIRKEAYDRNPDIARVFAPIAHKLTDSVMADLTRRMAADEQPPRDVARDWLERMAFISS